MNKINYAYFVGRLTSALTSGRGFVAEMVYALDFDGRLNTAERANIQNKINADCAELEKTSGGNYAYWAGRLDTYCKYLPQIINERCSGLTGNDQDRVDRFVKHWTSTIRKEAEDYATTVGS